MKKIMIGFSVAYTFSVAAFAQVNENDPEEGVKESVSEVGSQARMAFIDPETGKLVTKPESAGVAVPDAAVAPRVQGERGATKPVNLSGVASEPKLMPDGSRKIDFNGQFLNNVEAKIGPNGEVITGHHIDEADHGMEE